MKIALVYDMIYPFNIGGVEVRNYELAKRLSKKGHDIHLFGVKLWKGPDTIKLIEENITLHGICRYKNLHTFSGKRTILEPIKFAIALFKPLKNQKFDIIDASTFVYFHCFTCKAISIINKIPLIFTWHQYWGNYWYAYLGKFKGFIGKSIENISTRLTSNHIAVSKTTKKDLYKYKIDKDKIKIIYNGIDIKSINLIKKQKTKYDLIYLGRLTHQKNIQLLIKATSLLKENYPKIKVLIVGEGPEKNNLQKLTQKFNIKNNIEFVNFIKDKKEIYKLMKSSRIFVLPSLLEGFGIVILEANACGLPVIVIKTKWNASQELIENNINGLISKRNSKSLVLSIKSIFENEQLLNTMKKQAKEKSKSFDWDIITKELEDYYKKIIKTDGKNIS